MFRLLSRRSLFTITMSAASASAVYAQNRLAKTNPQSNFYWRNHAAISQRIFQIAHMKHVDHLMSLCKVFAPAEFTFTECFLLIYQAHTIRQLKIFFDKLDDILGNSQASDIVALGDAKLGTRLNQFLTNLLDAEDLKTINELTCSQLITEQELVAFCNLLAQKLYQQAQFTLCYQQAEDQDKKRFFRTTVAQLNVEVAGIYLALVVHMIKQDKRILALIHRPDAPQLSYADLKTVYRSATQAGELMQIAHDVPEFRYDLLQEASLHKISANYFLSILEGRIDQEEVKRLPNRAVGFYELPERVRTEFLTVSVEYKNKAKQINSNTAMLYGFFWDFEKAVGFFAQKPDRDKTNPWRDINLSNRIK